MDENESKVLKSLIWAATAVVALFVTSCQTTNYQVRKMVEAGAHPYSAACSIDGNAACRGLELIEVERVRSHD